MVIGYHYGNQIFFFFLNPAKKRGKTPVARGLFGNPAE
jgi:hypothetical protein